MNFTPFHTKAAFYRTTPVPVTGKTEVPGGNATHEKGTAHFSDFFLRYV